MRALDALYTATPFYGSRRLQVALQRAVWSVNRKRVQRLMRLMGIEAVGPKPRLSQPHPGHRVYPYLLRNVAIGRVDQVWSCDITYIRLRSGVVYLVAVLDWFSRYVLAWELSVTPDGQCRRDALERALATGRPAIFNADQGAQFTSYAFTSLLRTAACRSAWMAAAVNQSAGCASFASTSNPGQSTRDECASSLGSKPPKSSTRCSNTAPLVRPAPPTALVLRRRARTGSTTPPALALRVLSPPTDAGRPRSRLAHHRPPARRRSRRTAALCRLQPPRRHHLPALDPSSAPSGLDPNIAYPPRYFAGTEDRRVILPILPCGWSDSPLQRRDRKSRAGGRGDRRWRCRCPAPASGRGGTPIPTSGRCARSSTG